MVFSGAAVATPGWLPGSRSRRASAEPMLNAWAANLLPASNVRFQVERRDEAGAMVAESKEMLLNEVPLAPLDAVFFASIRSGEAMPDLERWALHVARAKFTALPAGATLSLNSQRRPARTARDFSLSEFAEAASRVRQLIGGARALDACDVSPLDRAVNDGVDLAEFEARTDAAEQALIAAVAVLQAQLRVSATADLTWLRSAIFALLGFGIAGAVPVPPAADESVQRTELLAQAAALLREATARTDKFSTLRAPAAANAAQRRSTCTERMRNVFGGEFLALPRFTAANGSELAQSLAASTQLQGGDRLAACTWFARSQRVREGVLRLGASLHAAESIGTGDRMRLAVAQLPHQDGDRWVGLPFEPPHAFPAGRLSLVLQGGDTLDTAQAMAGMLVDEWVEIVPSTHETTAIAFQYNPPDACAPQAILVAVPPVPGQPWTPWNLQRVLLETLDLARLRTIDAEALDTAALNPVADAEAVVAPSLSAVRRRTCSSWRPVSSRTSKVDPVKMSCSCARDGEHRVGDRTGDTGVGRAAGGSVAAGGIGST